MESDTHEVFDGDKLNICFLELNRFDNYLNEGADLKEQWCWIFNNLATFVERPDNLDHTFDDVIKDAGTGKLSIKQKIKYMEALHLNERERLVIQEGGYIIGHQDGLEKGRDEIRNEWHKQTIDNVKTMQSKGFDTSTIAECLGITPKEVESILSEMAKLDA